MSWHFLQGLEEVSSEAICWDGERFAPSNGPTILGEYCLPDSETESSPDSRSGMMSRPSAEIHGEGESMSSQADSRVKTSAQPEKEQESTGQNPECGTTWQGSFARFDRDSSSWKTPQCSLLEGLDEYSETWPRWGMMRNGACWERMTAEPPISATESGSLEIWPTPRAGDGEKRGDFDENNPRNGLPGRVKKLPTPTRHDGKDNASPAAILRKSPELGVVAQIWQTPTADDAVERKIGKWNSRGEPKLSAEVLIWPTPRTKGMCGGTGEWEQLKQATTIEEARKMGAGNGGQLNPPWVEWLMGWPIGWTALQPLEMDKYRQWQQQHSGF